MCVPFSRGHTFLQLAPSPQGLIFMSSLTAAVGCGYVSNYAATKAWIAAFAHGLAFEERDRLQVLSCVAGATPTPTYLHAMGRHRTRHAETLPE